jgi:hypothetical protein
MDKRKRTRKERQAERESEPAAPLRPDASDPRSDDPHDALSSPAEDADPTEYPDPFEKRPDPRGPESSDRAPGPSTSEPPPPRNYDQLKPEKGG